MVASTSLDYLGLTLVRNVLDWDVGYLLTILSCLGPHDNGLLVDHGLHRWLTMLVYELTLIRLLQRYRMYGLVLLWLVWLVLLSLLLPWLSWIHVLLLFPIVLVHLF